MFDPNKIAKTRENARKSYDKDRRNYGTFVYKISRIVYFYMAP